MPTSKEIAQRENARKWMIRQLMEEKERQARERLIAIELEQPKLKQIYAKYLEHYKLYILPLTHDVDRYINNIHEKRKLEHFLQGQADHLAEVEAAAQRPIERRPRESLAGFIGIEKLPYADKHQVGHKPRKEKAPSHDAAKEMMARLKALPPDEFAALLKKVGVK
jgi:hypothetical protein